MSENIYSVKVQCTNCKWEGFVERNKGVDVSSLASECPNCEVCGRLVSII